MDGMGKELQNLEEIHPEHNPGLQVLWGRFEYLGSSYNYKDSKILGLQTIRLIKWSVRQQENEWTWKATKK